MRRLRIALVLPAFEPAVEYGGPVVKVRLLAESLQELGHDPEIWCADYDAGGGRVPAGLREVSGVRVRYLRRLCAFRWSPVVPQGYTSSRSHRFDVGHLFGMRDGFTPFVAAGLRSAGTPFVLEPMGMFWPRVRRVSMKRAFDRFVPSPNLRHAAGLIATSERERADLELAGRRTWMRYNPVRAGVRPGRSGSLRRLLGVTDDHPLVGWVGRVSRSKGLEVLAGAMAQVPHAHAVLIGPDDRDGAAQQARRTVAALGIADRVHWLGSRYDDEKRRLLADVDVFVLPSSTESFGNAAVEAALLGLPVVITDRCGAAPLLERSAGAAVVRYSAADVAAGIRLQLARFPNGSVPGTLASEVDPIEIARQQTAIYTEVLPD